MDSLNTVVLTCEDAGSRGGKAGVRGGGHLSDDGTLDRWNEMEDDKEAQLYVAILLPWWPWWCCVYLPRVRVTDSAGFLLSNFLICDIWLMERWHFTPKRIRLKTNQNFSLAICTPEGKIQSHVSINCEVHNILGHLCQPASACLADFSLSVWSLNFPATAPRESRCEPAAPVNFLSNNHNYQIITIIRQHTENFNAYINGLTRFSVMQEGRSDKNR